MKLKLRKKALRKSSKKKEIGYRDGGEGMIKWCNENVFVPIYPEGSVVAVWYSMGDLPSEENPDTRKSYASIWKEQHSVLKEALRMENGRFVYSNIVLCWMRGEGKCQAKGSEVLMFDGSVKKVECVKVDDLLMGDDNTPRKVLSLASGTEEMFKIVPMQGETLTVTKDHVLSLKGRRRFVNRRGKPYHDSNAEKVTDISLKDYMKKNDSFKRYHMLFRTPIEFPEQGVSIDPYFLGVWLGDGHSTTPSVTTMDREVADYLQSYADKLGLRLHIYGKKNNKANTYHVVGERSGVAGTNTLLNFLRDYNLIGNKHIPQEYKANSRENRLKLLAGIIDSDGCVNRKSFDITQKSKTLSEDIVFLARSLGFHAEITKRIKTIKSIGFSSEYYRVGIVGDCSIIPTRIARKKIAPRSDWKDVLVTGIREIKSVGEQDYYGFNLDGNGRYVTAGFTVTHNSLLACLIQLWKFFNWPRQQIMLGANSKDQIKFVHFDIMRDIVSFSPNLLKIVGGKKNLQEKEIRIKDEEGNVRSLIRSISSFTGIVSNITGYTFSEIFDMKNPRFYTQLDGSIRNIPNSLGVIDSTVSEKTHILYSLYENAMKGKTKRVFFSYRCSREGSLEDYWNPHMTQAQLSDYKAKFPFGDYERYFLNLWSAGTQRIFSDEAIEGTKILSADGEKLNTTKIYALLKKKNHHIRVAQDVKEKGFVDGVIETENKISDIYERLSPVSSFYKLRNDFGENIRATMFDLQKLGDVFDTDWSLLAGLDFGDPLAVRGLARTLITFIAKGLPGSRSTQFTFLDEETAPKYIYFMLHALVIPSHSMDTAKEIIEVMNEEFDGIDMLCGERYRMWDMATWCENRDIGLEVIYPNYERQKEAFKEFLLAVNEGRWKCPTLAIPGSKKDDIRDEEMKVFTHDMDKKWFGSAEKKEKYGIQDDFIFSVGWTIYGGRMLGVDTFRSRKGNNIFFGSFESGDNDLVGNYV